MKIAFSFLGGKHWIAGVTILESILAALRSLDEERPTLALLVQPGKDQSEYETLEPLVDEILILPDSRAQDSRAEQRQALWQRAVRKLRSLALQNPECRSTAMPGNSCDDRAKASDKRMSELEKFLLTHGVDAFFTKNECRRFFEIPVIGWIPDFQQEHLPDMFTEEEISRRREYFHQVAESSSRVVLTSETVLRDYRKFLPNFAVKGCVMPFVTLVPEGNMIEDPSWILSEYELPERFIYLPNQYFKHKNHHTVLKALKAAVEKNASITVVSTGNTRDHRHPEFFEKFQSEIKELGLTANFRILGLVPYKHVFALMRQSLAVLQPSRFEGHPLSLAESKSMGKRIILSDIPVHRELAPEWAWFFDPSDEKALSALMLRLYDEAAPGPDETLEERMREENPFRVRHFAKTFVDIISEARKKEAACKA